MSGRELVILLLGLAIVAVVLRGLYVALHARRGQIKMAIDKNIPKDVDLDAIELAELPGGGARIVNRSLDAVNRQNSALDQAELKARAIDLADETENSHIPVLMDTVALSEAPQQTETIATEENPQEYGEAAKEDDVSASELEEDDYEQPEELAQEEHAPEENWSDEDEIVAVEESEEEYPAVAVLAEGEEDESERDHPDDVLFDYDEADTVEEEQSDQLSAVAPDYEERLPEEEESAPEVNDISDGDDYEARGYAEEEYDADYVDEQDVEQNVEDDTPRFDPESELDEFSMSAGERIGYNAPPVEPTAQSGLFDEVEANELPVKAKRKKAWSLRSLFKGKLKAEVQTHSESLSEVQVGIDAEPEYEQGSISQQTNFADQEEALQEYEEEVNDSFIDEPEEAGVAPSSTESEEQLTQPEEMGHSEVLVINVAAKQGRMFAGDDLLHILITSGLKFGEMNIFHKRLSKDSKSAVIFSVANMLNPGTFDLNNMDEFTTLGISFFLALPAAVNNLDAFEQMLGIAQGVRDTLDGELKDDHRNGMTEQTIEHYRQRIRDFELRRLKAVAASG
jgi:cell division protein ZipA